MFNILFTILFLFSPSALAQSPVIICDPAEIGCIPEKPTLGLLFDNVQIPAICAPFGGECTNNLPTLGPRFIQGQIGDFVPDIRPGECATFLDKFDIYQNVEPVETTYCEVQEYPETILENALIRIKGPGTPPVVTPTGPVTTVAGQSAPCTGLPGDPWWSADCSCHCPDTETSSTDGPVCDTEEEVLRSDIAITSPEECLQDPQPGGHFRSNVE